MPITWLIYYVITPIIGGLVASSAAILAKKPEAKHQLDMLAPYSGLLGIWMVVDGVLNASAFLQAVDEQFKGLLRLDVLLLVPSLLLCGVLLGAGLVAKVLFKDAASRVQVKLAAYSSPLGFVSIAAGFVFLLFWINILR